MKNENNRITHDRLTSLLSYSPETGLFTWIGRGHGIRFGQVAGTVRKNKPGVRLKLDNREYPANMAAFFYMKKRWAPFDVDHRDGNPNNNKWSNLREATRSQNIANKRNVPHSSPYKGIIWDKQTNKWRAQIKVNGNAISLGRFKDLEEAHEAYIKAAKEYFGEFACFRDETIQIHQNILPVRIRRSPYKGVRFNSKLLKWSVNYKRHPSIFLGFYDTFEVARRVYDDYAAQHPMIA